MLILKTKQTKSPPPTFQRFPCVPVCLYHYKVYMMAPHLSKWKAYDMAHEYYQLDSCHPLSRDRHDMCNRCRVPWD